MTLRSVSGTGNKHESASIFLTNQVDLNSGLMELSVELRLAGGAYYPLIFPRLILLQAPQKQWHLACHWQLSAFNSFLQLEVLIGAGNPFPAQYDNSD